MSKKGKIYEVIKDDILYEKGTNVICLEDNSDVPYVISMNLYSLLFDKEINLYSESEIDYLCEHSDFIHAICMYKLKQI